METKRPHNLEEQISAYLDGELSEAERAEVQERLESDPQARRLLAELRQVCHLVGSLPREHAPPEIMELVTAQIERHELLKDAPVAAYGIPRRRPRWGRIVASAAVIAMAASAGYLTFVSFRKPAATRTEERFGLVADAHRSTPPEGPRERTGPEATAKHKGLERRDADEPPAARPLPAARPPEAPGQAAQAPEPTLAARMREEVRKAPMATAPAVEIVRAREPARVGPDAEREVLPAVAAKAAPTAEGSRAQEAVTAVPPVAMADIPTERQAAGVAPEQAIAAVPEEPADRLEIELAFRDVASRVRAGREIVHSLNRLAGSVVARSDLTDEQMAERLRLGLLTRGLGASQSEQVGREPGQAPGRDSAEQRIVAHVAGTSVPEAITTVLRAAPTARAVGFSVSGRVVTDWEQVQVLAGGYGRYATGPSPNDSKALDEPPGVAGVPAPSANAAGATRAVGRRATTPPPARSRVEAEAERRRLKKLRSDFGRFFLGGELGVRSLGELPEDARTEASSPMTQPCPSVAPAGRDRLEAKAGTWKGGAAESAFDRAAASRPAPEASGAGRMPDGSPEPETSPPEDDSLRLRVVLLISPNPDGHPASAPVSGEQDRRPPATRPAP